MPIERIVVGPEVDFFTQDIYDAFGFSDVVRAGDFLYSSGVVPLRGSATDLQVVAEGDFRGQYEFVLGMLGTLLTRAGASFPRDVVSINVFCTDMEQVNANCDLFAKTFAGAYPAATYFGVAQLFHPAQQVEVNAVAYIGD